MGARDALKYVMVGLGNTKNTWSWLGHIPILVNISTIPVGGNLPFQVYAYRVRESYHSVSHESNSTALRSGTEESELDMSFFEVLGIVLDCFPRVGCHRLCIVTLVGQLNMKGRINLYQARKANLQQRNALWTKQTSANQ